MSSNTDDGGAHAAAVGADLASLGASPELRRRVSEVEALYRVAAAIGRATTLDELLAEAINALREATGADHASVLLSDEAHVMRFRAWRGLSSAYRDAVEGLLPWPPDAVDPEPLLFADLAHPDVPAALQRAALAEGIGALTSVPLVHGGRLLGAFTLYRNEPHDWTDAEVLLSRSIASHLASATVRTEAQEALRARATSSRRSCARSTRAS